MTGQFCLVPNLHSFSGLCIFEGQVSFGFLSPLISWAPSRKVSPFPLRRVEFVLTHSSAQPGTILIRVFQFPSRNQGISIWLRLAEYVGITGCSFLHLLNCVCQPLRRLNPEMKENQHKNIFHCQMGHEDIALPMLNGNAFVSDY